MIVVIFLCYIRYPDLNSGIFWKMSCDLESETALMDFSYTRERMSAKRQMAFCLNDDLVKPWGMCYCFHLTDEGIDSSRVLLNKLSVEERLVVWNCPLWARFNFRDRLIAQMIKFPCSNYGVVCLLIGPCSAVCRLILFVF